MDRNEAEPAARSDASGLVAGGGWKTVAGLAAAWLLTSVLGAWWFSRGDAGHGTGADFVAFWTAARALSTGENPYHADALRKFVPETGYEEVLRPQVGELRHMPFYYPIWFLFPLVPFLPLGFTLLRCLWGIWLLQAYFASTILVVRRAKGGSGLLQGAAVGATLLWLPVFHFGQPVPLLLLAALAAVQCWDARRDVAAGACMALMMAKPQLGLLPTAAFFWIALRRRRSRAAAALVGVSVGLAAAGLVLLPTWPLDFLAAPRKNPGSSFHQLGYSTTFYEYVRTFVGFDGAAGVCGAAALFAVAALLLSGLIQMGWDRRTTLDRTVAAAVLATFFVIPYVRSYDLPILAVVVAHLMNRRPESLAAKAFLLVWWLGAVVDLAAVLAWDRSIPLLAMQMHYGWLALWTAVWWLWDAFAPREAETAPDAPAESPEGLVVAD